MSRFKEGDLVHTNLSRSERAIYKITAVYGDNRFQGNFFYDGVLVDNKGMPNAEPQFDTYNEKFIRPAGPRLTRL